MRGIPTTVVFVVRWFTAVVVVACLSGRAQAVEVGGTLAVTRFEFRYAEPAPDLPPLEPVAKVNAYLYELGGIYTAAAGSALGTAVRLDAVPKGRRFDAAGLEAVAAAVVGHFNGLGLQGVWVAFDDIELRGGRVTDLRANAEDPIELVIWTSRVARVRTLARGHRLEAEDAEDSPTHGWLKERSPLREPPGGGAAGSLFRKEPLEEFLRSANRHPGRRVEASVASAGEPGRVMLDYLVTEARPWRVYGQVSNTGTETTGEWRIRTGYQHQQLTNRDDVLQVDLVTTPDFDTNAAFLSYQFPLARPGQWRVRVFGSYGDFVADGLSLQDLRWTGDNWLAGAELSQDWQVWGGWEVEAVAGASYAHYEIDSRIADVGLGSGSSSFLIPYAAVEARKRGDWWSVRGRVRVEHSVDGIPDEDPRTGIAGLGRLGVDPSWTAVRPEVEMRVQLDPFIGSSRTRIHDLTLRGAGRVLLDGGRVVPQEQVLLGGASTVRGYPESAVAGDESLLFTAEYAYHLTAGLEPAPPGELFGRPFRWRPAEVGKPTDWELVLRAFVDTGLRFVNPPTTGASAGPDGEVSLAERDVQLFGGGLGAELSFPPWVSLRCDFGVAFRDLRETAEDADPVAEAGDVRAHVTATFAW